MTLLISLHTRDPSKRLHVLVLNTDANTFLKVKISSPKEVLERGSKRKYKNYLKNAFMIFKIDCCDALDTVKKNKKNKEFRQYSESFGDSSFLWNNSPKEVKDEYEKVFIDYRKLIPKDFIIIPYNPETDGNDPSEFEEAIQDNYPNLIPYPI